MAARPTAASYGMSRMRARMSMKTAPSEGVDDCAGDAFRTAGLDERTREDARGENAENRGGHALHARNGVFDRFGESAAAEESARDRAHHERIGGLHARQHERDGEDEADGCAERGEDGIHGFSFPFR